MLLSLAVYISTRVLCLRVYMHGIPCCCMGCESDDDDDDGGTAVVVVTHLARFQAYVQRIDQILDEESVPSFFAVVQLYRRVRVLARALALSSSSEACEKVVVEGARGDLTRVNRCVAAWLCACDRRLETLLHEGVLRMTQKHLRRMLNSTCPITHPPSSRARVAASSSGALQQTKPLPPAPGEHSSRQHAMMMLDMRTFSLYKQPAAAGDIAAYNRL